MFVAVALSRRGPSDPWAAMGYASVGKTEAEAAALCIKNFQTGGYYLDANHMIATGELTGTAKPATPPVELGVFKG